MIFKIEEAEMFRKFAELADKHRYVCYKSKLHGFLMLRPIKSSKNLDTAIYIGLDDKHLEKFLESKYEMITVSEITFMIE